MAHYKFPSIAHPEKFGYAFDTAAYSSTSETCGYFRQFETCGDGITQHSRDWSVTFEYLTDFLSSLAAAMLADEKLTRDAAFTVRRESNNERIAFAAGVVFKESDRGFSTRRFFSMSLRKIGKSPTYQHDKRFEEVNRWHDGSRASIYRLVTSEHSSGLERYQNACAVKEWADAQTKHVPSGENFPVWFDGDFEKNRRLRSALTACCYIADAVERRECALSTIDNYRASVAAVVVA